MLAAFPQLEADDLSVVTRLRDVETRKVLIDVVKQTEPPFRIALKHTHTVRLQDQTYKIPLYEMAIAMKFATMISPNS